MGIFVGTVVAMLLVALIVDAWDRRNGRDPRQRAEVIRSRSEHRHRARVDLRIRRVGGSTGLEDQFRAPSDDHDIRPERRRPG